MEKKKRINKEKAQIAQEMQQRSETLRKRKFVGEILFPLLQEHTKTVREAKMFCKVISNDILSTFNEGMKQPLSSLRIEEKFATSKEEGPKAVRALVEAFKAVTIGEALELLDGMPNAIDAAIQFESTGRKLSELEWNDGTIMAKKHVSFEEILPQTTYCNDFRQLGDGTWMAYSTKIIPGTSDVYMASGTTIYEALLNLKKLCE